MKPNVESNDKLEDFKGNSRDVKFAVKTLKIIFNFSFAFEIQ